MDELREWISTRVASWPYWAWIIAVNFVLVPLLFLDEAWWGIARAWRLARETARELRDLG